MTSTGQPGDDPDPGRAPVHVAWVSSGSERWSALHGATDDLATQQERALLELIDGAVELGIRWLTVQEPTVARQLARHAGELGRRGIEVRELAAGTPLLVPAAEATGPTVLTVMAATGYSGRTELVDAVRRLAAEGADPAGVDERSLSEHLYGPDVPDPDLLVRTGADRRVPDLLLWEVAYSELVFVDELWPDVGREHLVHAVAEYQRRDRRYGGLVASGDRP